METGICLKLIMEGRILENNQNINFLIMLEYVKELSF